MKYFSEEAPAIALARSKGWLMQVVSSAKSKSAAVKSALRKGWLKRQLWIVKDNHGDYVGLVKPQAHANGPLNARKRKTK